MEPTNGLPDESYEYHPFAIDYATVDRQRLSKPDNLPTVFKSGSSDWTATLIDILDWDPNEVTAHDDTGLPGTEDEDIDEVYQTSSTSGPSLTAPSPTAERSPVEKTTDIEQEADRTKLQVRSQGSNDEDATSTSIFKCPFTDCKKEYAQQDNIYRHAQTAHTSHVFTCLRGTWTITPKDEKQDTPNKQQTKRKTPPKDDSYRISPSVKRKKQVKSQSVLDRGDSASPMLSDFSIPPIKKLGLDVVDATTDTDDACGGVPKSDSASPILLHGISEAAKGDEIEGQAFARSLHTGGPRTASPSRETSSFAVDVEQRPLSPTTPKDMPPCNQTDPDVKSSAWSSLEMPKDSINVRCETPGDSSSSLPHFGRDAGQPHSYDDGLEHLVAPGLPLDTRSERVRRPSYEGLHVPDQVVGASSHAEGVVNGESEMNELAQSQYFPEPQATPQDTAGNVSTQAQPSSNTKKFVATKERKTRAMADRIIARNGFENAEGLVNGESRRKTQKKDLKESKTTVATKAMRSRGKK